MVGAAHLVGGDVHSASTSINHHEGLALCYWAYTQMLLHHSYCSGFRLVHHDQVPVSIRKIHVAAMQMSNTQAGAALQMLLQWLQTCTP